MPVHRVHIAKLPAWLDLRRLLGPGGWRFEAEGARLAAHAELETEAACDLAARLRGQGFDGEALELHIEPPPGRSATREARTRDARRRRETTPGFSRAGARLDAEGRMSLTPEALALRMAKANTLPEVIDAGCGAGGNAIAFARAGAAKRVVAIERDPSRLADARHNAKLYAVADRIDFVEGDALRWLDTQREAGRDFRQSLLFCDPPWGADWDRKGCRLSDFPLLEALCSPARHEAFGALWAKLPPSFAVSQLEGASAQAYFGEAEGDARRVKFVVLRT